jgi:hypothetical protein
MNLNFRQLVSPKLWCLYSILHGVTSRNILVFIYWHLWCYILYLQITEQISLMPVASLGRVIGYLDSDPLCFFFISSSPTLTTITSFHLLSHLPYKSSLTSSCYTACDIDGRMFHTNRVNGKEVKNKWTDICRCSHQWGISLCSEPLQSLILWPHRWRENPNGSVKAKCQWKWTRWQPIYRVA